MKTVYSRGAVEITILGEDKDLERYLIKYGYSLWVEPVPVGSVALTENFSDEVIETEVEAIEEPVVEEPEKKVIKKRKSKV